MLGGVLPGFRGALTAFYNGLVCMNNPYPKPWKFRLNRVLKGWDGAVWHPTKAQISLDPTIPPPAINVPPVGTVSLYGVGGGGEWKDRHTDVDLATKATPSNAYLFLFRIEPGPIGPIGTRITVYAEVDSLRVWQETIVIGSSAEFVLRQQVNHAGKSGTLRVGFESSTA